MSVPDFAGVSGPYQGISVMISLLNFIKAYMEAIVGDVKIQITHWLYDSTSQCQKSEEWDTLLGTINLFVVAALGLWQTSKVLSISTLWQTMPQDRKLKYVKLFCTSS